MAKWSDVLGAGVSGLGGAASGAAVGTALGGPGLGTGIGAGIGAIAGIGASAADTIQNKKLEQAAERQQEALRKALKNTSADLGAYVNSVNMGGAEQTRQLVSRTADAGAAMGLAPTQSISAMQDARRRGDMAAFEKASEAVRTAAIIDGQRKDAVLRQFGVSQELANSAMDNQSNIAQNFGAIAGSAALAAGIISGPRYQPKPYEVGSPKIENGAAQVELGKMPSPPVAQAGTGSVGGSGRGRGRDAYAYRSGSTEPFTSKDTNNIFDRSGAAGPGGKAAPVPFTAPAPAANATAPTAAPQGEAVGAPVNQSIFDENFQFGGGVVEPVTSETEKNFYKQYPNLLTHTSVETDRGEKMNVAQVWAELGVDYSGDSQALAAEAKLFSNASFSTEVQTYAPWAASQGASGVFLDAASYDAMNAELGSNATMQTDGFSVRRTRHGDIFIYGRGTKEVYIMPGPGNE